MSSDNPGLQPIIFFYIPGKANYAADALSKNIALFSLVTDASLFPELSEIKVHQRSDPFCVVLIYFLESEDARKLPKL